MSSETRSYPRRETTDAGEIFTLGVLSGIEHCAARDCLAALPAVWSQACDPAHLTALNR